MAAEARTRKLADRIKVIVAEMLELRVKDPRLGFVTVTDVRMTNDLREANVFYTVFGDEEQRVSTAAALASATGLIRSEVGRLTGIKHTPSISFTLDALPDNARHLDDLLQTAAILDAQVHAVAEGKSYAGDADPYKHPHVEDDDDEAADESA